MELTGRSACSVLCNPTTPPAQGRAAREAGYSCTATFFLLMTTPSQGRWQRGTAHSQPCLLGTRSLHYCTDQPPFLYISQVLQDSPHNHGSCPSARRGGQLPWHIFCFWPRQWPTQGTMSPGGGAWPSMNMPAPEHHPRHSAPLFSPLSLVYIAPAPRVESAPVQAVMTRPEGPFSVQCITGPGPVQLPMLLLCLLASPLPPGGI